MIHLHSYRRLSRTLPLAATVLLGVATATAAPINYTTSGGVYAENFNQNLPVAAVTLPWEQGTTFSGWYAQFDNPVGDESNPPDEYRQTFGQSTGIRIYQWRASASATNGALGAIPINDTGDIHIALGLTNQTGQTLTSFNLGYTGQQWRVTTSGPTSITVSYQLGELANDLTAGTWSSINALTFTSPNSNAGTATNINGTNAENSQVFAPVSISALNWEPGQQLWIRFTVQNISGFAQGLAIDDLTFSAIPEPSSLGLWLGWFGLGGAVFLRRARRV